MKQTSPDKEDLPEGPEALLAHLRWILAGLGMSGIKDWPIQPKPVLPSFSDQIADAIGPEPPPQAQDTTPWCDPDQPPSDFTDGNELAASSPVKLPSSEQVLPETPLSQRVAPEQALRDIREKMGDCKRCRLHSGRTNLVFADGSFQAPLVFVGEGPGFDEDRQGLPFVGKAGKLLDKMIKSIGFKRPEVYICNVVKCRPPGNRTPSPDEIEVCSPYMFEQIQAIQPQVICALGACAAQTLLGTTNAISRLRGRIHMWRGIPLICTFHPAYLLRNPAQKSATWQDLLTIFELIKKEDRRQESGDRI